MRWERKLWDQGPLGKSFSLIERGEQFENKCPWTPPPLIPAGGHVVGRSDVWPGTAFKDPRGDRYKGNQLKMQSESLECVTAGLSNQPQDLPPPDLLSKQ